MIKGKKYSDEFSISLASLDEKRIEALRNIMSKHSKKVDIPPDLKVFYQASELEMVLNGVREKILNLLEAVQ